ncbi:MAG: hypothetical protein VB092_04890 [Oscillospiraceae bacterium]|nr:hypothetical protein [Oscillospiraceae bacterium]
MNKTLKTVLLEVAASILFCFLFFKMSFHLAWSFGNPLSSLLQGLTPESARSALLQTLPFACLLLLLPVVFCFFLKSLGASISGTFIFFYFLFSLNARDYQNIYTFCMELLNGSMEWANAVVFGATLCSLVLCFAGLIYNAIYRTKKADS